MKTIRNTDKIRVLGVTFKDIHEAITYAQEGKPKKGVYVGVISERYPCFDSHDYAYIIGVIGTLYLQNRKWI